MLIKNVLFLIVLSIVAIFFQNQLMAVLHGIMSVHHQIIKGLSSIFSIEGAGEIVQSVLALLLMPVVIGICFGIAHFLMKQQHFPHTMSVIWVCWAVLLTAVLSQTGHVTNQTAEEIQSAHKIAEAVKSQQVGNQIQSPENMAEKSSDDFQADAAATA